MRQIYETKGHPLHDWEMPTFVNKPIYLDEILLTDQRKIKSLLRALKLDPTLRKKKRK